VNELNFLGLNINNTLSWKTRRKNFTQIKFCMFCHAGS
jgi:hypothetical protein